MAFVLQRQRSQVSSSAVTSVGRDGEQRELKGTRVSSAIFSQFY